MRAVKLTETSRPSPVSPTTVSDGGFSVALGTGGIVYEPWCPCMVLIMGSPQSYPLGGSYQFQYDPLERLTSMTSGGSNLATAAYNQANQMTSLWTTYTNATETRTYNNLLQLTRETVPGLKDMQYGYNSGSNNGQVASTTDNISGETVQYTYDSLQRLIQAQTSSGGTQWGEAYSYDGFGNLTGKTPTQGSAPALSVTYNPATNQPTSGGYDANGNAPVGTWDAENHLVQQTLDGNLLNWVYGPDGKRVAQFQQMSGYGQWTFYVYGATGQLIGQIGCSLYPNPSSNVCAAERTNVYFGARLIARMESQSGTMVAEGVVTDRLGTVRAVQTSAGWSRLRTSPTAR